MYITLQWLDLPFGIFLGWPPLSKSTLVLLAVNCWSTSGPGIWGFCHLLRFWCPKNCHNTNAIFIPLILPGFLHFGIWDFALVIFGETSKGPLTLLQLPTATYCPASISSVWCTRLFASICIHLYHVVSISKCLKLSICSEPVGS